MVDDRVVFGAKDSLHVGIGIRVHRQAVCQHAFRIEFFHRLLRVVPQMLRIALVDVRRLAVGYKQQQLAALGLRTNPASAALGDIAAVYDYVAGAEKQRHDLDYEMDGVVIKVDALADQTRRDILDLLRKRERSAGQVAARFAISRPAVSRHLRVLRNAGLVAHRKEAQSRLYRLVPEGLREVDRWLDSYRAFWTARMHNLKRYVEGKT